MRLIDADKVHTIIVDEMWDADDFPHDRQQAVLSACYSILERIEKRAPTVKAIPIDKPFLKMRYGDYVVYNKKWLVDHLQTEWNILQGKEYQPSIPIEWIEKQMAERENYGDFNTAGAIGYLLLSWEEENGKKTV